MQPRDDEQLSSAGALFDRAHGSKKLASGGWAKVGVGWSQETLAT